MEGILKDKEYMDISGDEFQNQNKEKLSKI